MQELSLFNLEKRKMREDLINEYKYLKDICQEYGIKLFLVVPSDRMRNTDYKVKHKKFYPSMRKNLFTLKRKSIGTGCSGRSWSPPFWRYTKPTWIHSFVICSR